MTDGQFAAHRVVSRPCPVQRVVVETAVAQHLLGPDQAQVAEQDRGRLTEVLAEPDSRGRGASRRTARERRAGPCAGEPSMTSSCSSANAWNNSRLAAAAARRGTVGSTQPAEEHERRAQTLAGPTNPTTSAATSTPAPRGSTPQRSATNSSTKSRTPCGHCFARCRTGPRLGRTRWGRDTPQARTADRRHPPAPSSTRPGVVSLLRSVHTPSRGNRTWTDVTITSSMSENAVECSVNFRGTRAPFHAVSPAPWWRRPVLRTASDGSHLAHQPDAHRTGDGADQPVGATHHCV